MKVVSVINHKGGVGKTTTTINLAAALVKLDKAVLVIDLDTQMNLTHSLIGDLDEKESHIADIMQDDKVPLRNAIKPTSIKGLDLVPAGESMVDLELKLHSVFGRENKLKNAIQRANLQFEYDFVLIDNPPHIGLTTVNSLIASHYYLVPVSAEYLPLVGIKNLLRSIHAVSSLNPGLLNLGYLLTMVDRREKIATSVENILREAFPSQVLKTVIRVNTKLKACPQKKQTIFDVENDKGHGHEDFLNAAKEILRRI